MGTRLAYTCGLEGVSAGCHKVVESIAEGRRQGEYDLAIGVTKLISKCFTTMENICPRKPSWCHCSLHFADIDLFAQVDPELFRHGEKYLDDFGVELQLRAEFNLPAGRS